MTSTPDHARRLLALARNGLHFARDPYDRERYEEIAQIAARLLADTSPGAGLTGSAVLELWEREPGYITPKLEVRGAIFRGAADRPEVLLVRETIDGRWTLPGGWVDVNESPRQAIEKEILQESGYSAAVDRLAAVYDKLKHGHPPSLFHAWKLFFLCRITGGEPRCSIETDAVDFFPLDALPELSLPRTTPAQVLRMYEHHLAPDLQPDVD